MLTLTGFGQQVTDLIKNATSATTVTVLSVDGQRATVSREAAQAVLAARSAEAIAKRAKEAAESILKSEVGESTTEIYVGNDLVFTWVEQQKIVLDTARLKAEMPAIYAAYSKTQVTRPLLSKPKIVAALFG